MFRKIIQVAGNKTMILPQCSIQQLTQEIFKERVKTELEKNSLMIPNKMTLWITGP